MFWTDKRLTQPRQVLLFVDEDLELALENGEVPSREMYEAYIKDEVNSMTVHQPPPHKVNSRPQTHPGLLTGLRQLGFE